MLHSSIVLRALWPREQAASPTLLLSSLLENASFFSIPCQRQGRGTQVPTHPNRNDWDHSQLRELKCQRLAARRSDKQIVSCQDKGGGRMLDRPDWGFSSGCDATWREVFWETDPPLLPDSSFGTEIIYSMIFSSCRFVRDERRHHLHGDESGVGAREKQLWLLLHPGVGGLPLGAHQRTHLRHLEEARMRRGSIPEFPVTQQQVLSAPFCSFKL